MWSDREGKKVKVGIRCPKGMFCDESKIVSHKVRVVRKNID